jgi:polysaccharide pyruvyl transferase WcaK-like protein
MVRIMNSDRPLFILAGNGPYDNRGCEAIVRGTVKILRKNFKDPKFVCISNFNNDDQYQTQSRHEIDSDIIHFSTNKINKEKIISNYWKPSLWSNVFRYYSKSKSYKYWVYDDLLKSLNNSSAVLSIGGDNYAIDFGLCTLVTDLDDIVLENNKPLFLWGSSVGPFSAIPEYEQYMSEHLKRVTGVFAREAVTIEYLNSIGVIDNVFPVADPAFVMDAVEPKGWDDMINIEDGGIGINLSALMAKYVTGGDLNKWKKMAASIIENVARTSEMQIYLIPHVTIPNSNDYEFMHSALSLLPNKLKNITLLPAYNAEETKWVISKMTLFAGARTHATIAALSSEVPTISFAYSIKAIGINKDIFGHSDYVIPPDQLTSDAVTRKISMIRENHANIQNELREKIPGIQEKAYAGGEYMKRFLYSADNCCLSP